MKSITILLFLILFFASCENLCSDIQSQYDACQNELDSTKAALTLLTTENQSLTESLNKAIHKTDSLQLQNAGLLADKSNLIADLHACNTTMAVNQSAFHAALGEKQNQIELLASQLAHKSQSYDNLFNEHNELLSKNYVVLKTKVNGILDKANEDIAESETAYNQILTIDPIPQDALKETAKNLNFNYGIRHNIGHVFNIQVQSGTIDTAKD